MPDQYNATRFALKPLPQPSYRFQDVPPAAPDLRNSVLQYVNDRDHFQECMAEMLLLCKEAIRRKRAVLPPTIGSKPLSLEYLADRLDVDDPCWGYLVRSAEGMLQGFITVTTFTNYQATFRWDSRHPSAFLHDDQEMEELRLLGVRQWDADGALARNMQDTVRCGNVWAEGIVWPRIAEISLLGGLGCGKALVSLVLEQLEGMRATGTGNYDYVILQATDNSIPFYENIGFCRVGSVVKDEGRSKSKRRGSGSTTESEASILSVSSSTEAEAVEIEAGSPEKTDALALPEGYAMSPTTLYTVKKAGESVNDVAKKLQVDAWDIVFLNSTKYPELTPGSRLLANTVLYTPAHADTKLSAHECSAVVEMPRWHVANENDTPRMIAKMFNVNCLDLIAANEVRLPGLVSSSRLKAGTNIKVSHLNVHEEQYKAYAHWTSPDDEFEEGEPSYMMARRLERRKGAAPTRDRPLEQWLAVKISNYEPTSLVLPPSPAGKLSPMSAQTALPIPRPDQPEPPKRPPTSFMVFANHQRNIMKAELSGKPSTIVSKILGEKWQSLPSSKKSRYERIANEAKESYLVQKERYNQDLAEYLQTAVPENATLLDTRQFVDGTPAEARQSLYNKVVRLKPGATAEVSDHTYWYVLTFIPDLKWCHLAPMRKVGVFGPEKPRAAGRPKWMLVDEKLGQEVDISSSYCIPIKARTMRHIVDADREEWDIIDDGTSPFASSVPKKSTAKSSGRASEVVRRDSVGSVHRFHETESGRKRKRESVYAESIVPLVALRPGAQALVTVWLCGHGFSIPGSHVKRKRGRPLGSKDSVKRKPGESKRAMVQNKPLLKTESSGADLSLPHCTQSLSKKVVALPAPLIRPQLGPSSTHRPRRKAAPASFPVDPPDTDGAACIPPRRLRLRRSAAPTAFTEVAGSDAESDAGVALVTGLQSMPALLRDLVSPAIARKNKFGGRQVRTSPLFRAMVDSTQHKTSPARQANGRFRSSRSRKDTVPEARKTTVGNDSQPVRTAQSSVANRVDRGDRKSPRRAPSAPSAMVLDRPSRSSLRNTKPALVGNATESVPASVGVSADVMKDTVPGARKTTVDNDSQPVRSARSPVANRVDRGDRKSPRRAPTAPSTMGLERPSRSSPRLLRNTKTVVIGNAAESVPASTGVSADVMQVGRPGSRRSGQSKGVIDDRPSRNSPLLNTRDFPWRVASPKNTSCPKRKAVDGASSLSTESRRKRQRRR